MSHYSYGLGAACYGCGKGGKKNRTNPPKVNTKLAKKYGWSVRSGGKYKAVNDPVLANAVYCFQHIMEQMEEQADLKKGLIKSTDLLCTGTCAPKTVMKECYNRDGMLGHRTLQLVGNAIAAGKTTVGGLVLADINLPAAYKVKKTPPAVPDEDARADLVTGTGPASARHVLKKKQDASVLRAGAGDGTSWWLIAGLGVVAAGAIGYYKYDTDPKFRTKVKKFFG